MKTFKQNNKIAVYLSPEVVQALGIGEGDEVDFFKQGEKAFVFMKKADVASLISGGAAENKPIVQRGSGFLENEEIEVLKKLDTLRYQDRTRDNVDKMLNDAEKEVLGKLVQKDAVKLFRKNNSDIYSISKSVYDRFLMRKKPVQDARPVKIQLSGHMEGPYAPFVKRLEENGYLVMQTEAEAGGVSLALEHSIRQGKVLGTRSFNKKFYIVTRQFFDQNSSSIIKAIRDGAGRISDISSKAGIGEDAAKAVLYLLSENGDVREKRRDYFVIA